MFEICPHNNCTGCTACASICPHKAISMRPDEWGFLRPHINTELCVKCGACRNVCPALQYPNRRIRLGDEQFYAAYHKDEETRMNSSSGGAFSALATSILKEGGYVCAAAFDKNCKSVKHIIINRTEDLAQLRTSKYTQSQMGTCYTDIKNLLRSEKSVLFVGTPCQVAGLHLFLKKEYINLTTADILCHGVPAPVVYQDYVEWLNSRYSSSLTSYNFRDKKWSWFHFNMKGKFKNGKTYYGTWEEDPFYRGFLNDLFLRECCYSCPYSKHKRYADITLSDFWGYNSAEGGFPDDDKGISMCMCNTEKGLFLFNNAKDSLVHCVRPRKMSLCNGAFTPRLQNLETRTSFLKFYKNNNFETCINLYFSPQPVNLRLKLLYKFGRNSIALKLYDIYSKCRHLFSRVCRRLKRIFKQNKSQ